MSIILSPHLAMTTSPDPVLTASTRKEFKLEGEVLKAGLPKEIAGSKHSAVIRQVLEKEITESIQEIKKVEFQEKEKEEGKRPEKQE